MHKIYIFITYFLIPLIYLNTFIRLIKKKEDNNRYKERFGFTNLKKNNELDISDLNMVFKELFSTELFSEIIFNLKGDSLIVKVKENPIINRIALEGNKRVKDDDILPEILLKPPSSSLSLSGAQSVPCISLAPSIKYLPTGAFQ